LGGFDLADRCHHEPTKFQALFFGNRCPQVLDFRLILSYKNHKGHIGNAGHPGIADQLRVERQRAGQWVKGKSCNTFAPPGPFLATPDEIRDPHNLGLGLSVNGVVRQNSNTSDLIFRLPKLISYLSEFMTLLPGDVISTGTPEGVGLGMKPAQYLKPGDVAELFVEGLGKAKQKAVAYRAS
jgi:Fumarylacetoacetate (FAA) hydrolase family